MVVWSVPFIFFYMQVVKMFWRLLAEIQASTIEQVFLSPLQPWLVAAATRIGVTGCGPDIFFYAPLVRPSLQLEETCTVTGPPIRLVFTPSGVERVEPSGAVVPLPHPLEPAIAPSGAAGECGDPDGDAEKGDANVCVQWPLFSSAEAAQGLMAHHPKGRVFPIKAAWDLF